MSQLKDPRSDLSISINTATDIYTLKKPFLIQYCENKNLKSTGTTTELRARLSRYLRGAITLEDVDDSLDVEKRNIILNNSITNKIDLKNLLKDAELSDSSPDQKDSNKNPSATCSTSLALYDNLNNSLNSFSNRVEKILGNSNKSDSNSQDQSTQLYQNTLIHFEDSITSPKNSKHIYQEIVFNKDNSTNNQANPNLNTNSILPPPIPPSKRRMNEKTLMIKPDNFTGTEDVRKFFKQYNKISDINEWNENDKLKYFSIFVKGTASTFLENLEDQKGNWSWKELEEIFLNEFQPIGHDTILQIKLEKRRQGENESTTSFLAEIESLCRQVNKHMSEKDICGYILKGLKNNILKSISMQDNNSLKNLKENLKKFELMQFRIKNKKDDMSEYTEILNEQVLQLNQKTKDIEIENNELKRQIKDSFSRDRENKININKLSDEIQKINLLRKRSVYFDDNNKQKNNNRDYNENRGRSYNRNRDVDNDKREYRDNSPYPRWRNDSEERNYNKRDNSPYPSKLYNRYYRDNSKDNSYNRDRSYSRERKNNYDSSRESSRDRSYDRDFKTYKHRDDQDRETRGNYKQYGKNKDEEKRYTKNRQYSRENSRERVPGKYREDRYAKESERVTCYRCNERGHYADNCKMPKND